MDQQDTARYSIYFKNTSFSPPNPSEIIHFIYSTLLQPSKSFANRPYIWHHHSFTLSGPTENTPTSSFPDWTTYQGTLHYGDCIEDEWVVVWILKRITENWRQAVATIEDDDGHFLLIEAADGLPKWVGPENADNRVFIHDSQLHLIPPSLAPLPPPGAEDDEPALNLKTALELVLDEDKDTAASSKIQELVWKRTKGYPQSLASSHLHTTLAYLPPQIATALRADPQLISQAIGEWVERDPDGIKATRSMSNFPPPPFSPSSSSSAPDIYPSASSKPPTSESNPILTKVHLTRPLYAQLLLQNWWPPKPFLRAGWFPDEEKERPEVKGTGGKNEEEEGKTKDKKWRQIGCRITCGFEIAYNAGLRDKPSSSEPTADPPSYSELQTNPSYLKMLNHLKEVGYFGPNLLQGSKEWQSKEAGIRRLWWKQQQQPRNQSGDTSTSSLERTRDFKTKLENALMAVAASDDSSISGGADLKEDFDDWMEMSAEGLEELLANKGGDGRTKPSMKGLGEDTEGDMNVDDDDNEEDEEGNGDAVKEKAEKLGDLQKMIEGFVEKGEGDWEGARFEDETFSDDEDDESEDEKEQRKPSDTEMRAAQDKLVPPLPENEWGAKAESQPIISNEDSRGSKRKRPDLSDSTSQLRSSSLRFEPEKYEGVSDDSSDEDFDEDNPPGQMDFDGMDGGDIEMEGELDEFLNFARDALGLSSNDWEKILDDRKGRGAFVPPSKNKTEKGKAPSLGKNREKTSLDLPTDEEMLANYNRTDNDAETSTNSTLPPLPSDPPTRARSTPYGPLLPPDHPKLQSGNLLKDIMTKPDGDENKEPKQPKPSQGKYGNLERKTPTLPPMEQRNPKLNSFETLMDAMEAELAKSKKGSGVDNASKPSGSSSKNKARVDLEKGKAKVVHQNDNASSSTTNGAKQQQPSSDNPTEEELMAQMDAELSSLLQRNEGEDGEPDEQDVHAMKNFLESISSQGGRSGPLGNLIGRLDPSWGGGLESLDEVDE